MKSAQASGTTAMSEARLQQLCNQHGLYTWAEGQALAHEICRLRLAPAQPEYDVRPDLLVLLSWVRGLKTGEPIAPGEVDAMLKIQIPDLVTFAESRSAPAQPEQWILKAVQEISGLIIGAQDVATPAHGISWEFAKGRMAEIIRKNFAERKGGQS